jgi:endo-1,3-1,4-beta-glycanase ExoK
MPSSWGKQIGIALLASAGCVMVGCAERPASSAYAGWSEMAVFDQLSSTPPMRAIGGRAPDPGFIVDFTRGYDDRSQLLSNWFMDAGWLKADFSPHNVRFDGSGMTLTVTRRNGGPTAYVGAEFQRDGFYGFGRYEVVMRTAEAQGVVSSFFTHTGDYFGDKHSEIDFEFVGSKTAEAHTNYFWDGQSDALDVQLWFDASEALHLYAFEWLPDSITWYVDGIQIRRVEAGNAAAPIPQTSARVIANIWAANEHAVEWVGEAEGPGGSALYLCMSHVPDGRSGPQCSDSFTPPAR